MRNKGKEGGKDWYRFIQGRRKDEASVCQLNVNGQKLCDRELMVSVVKDFWENIGGMNEIEANNNITNLLIRENDMSKLDVEITKGEVESILKHLKNRKVTGNNNIPYEIYKCRGDSISERLVIIFKAI